MQGATVVAVNVAARQWTVGTLTLSGLEALPSGPPRATILALHGGGYTAKYWDHPLDDGASLLRIGADLGYRVIALDRPGYGASFGLTGEVLRAAAQARVLAEYEQSSDSDASVLDEVRNLYRACLRLLPQWQVASGHNISLHYVARAYHLRAVAFFDEVLATQGA